VSPARLLCVGETLWDVLPHGEYLGGAPLNVAAHATRLGLGVGLVSRVGNDERGRRALAEIGRRGVDAALLQVDPALPTGIAEATLDATGSASYRFPAPCAWDALAAPATALAAARGATVVYGTLAQRSASGAAALARLLDVAGWRVFDANLRAPHDGREVALDALRRADFVKLNEHEVRAFAGWLGVAAEPAVLQGALAADFGVRSLCVTEGARGARLWHDGAFVAEPAQPTEVVDTIGAGDAFLAMLVTALLCGSSPVAAMRRAARLASFVASRRGAWPDYDPARFRD
jgi:fructokinase